MLPPLTHSLRTGTDRGCSWTVTATEADDTATTEARRPAAGIGHLEELEKVPRSGIGEVTLEYVKAMYSKFVSTVGELNYNRELYRPDWMHLIRSQAFANLWTKAFKAYKEGLTLVRAMGTDELHVIGDWRAVFPEGRGVSEVKIKDTYVIGFETP
ncbi:hypothetical protein SAMN02787118_11171 [Streptomyces mirabilis]|jgi:hypothetical protein|uniref:Uncharacterized protein n=1 Tax=Streptomyces mirabilis TaxID=68239 RepID=A0A1I2L051_9ACTN|nr:hypothetical protein SAMN02787118_11171 [Streptomyces mirabilis]